MSRSAIACRTANYGAFQSIAYRHLASLGIQHVEIPVPQPGRIEQAQTALSDFGLFASSLQGACDLSRADVTRQIEQQMPAFGALHTRIMFVSVKAGDLPLDIAYGRLREAAEAAAAHGVTIVIETHPDLATNADVALRTLEAVDHPHLRLNFDTANVYFYNRGVDGVQELRKVVAYVAAVHLKDTDGGYRHWHFPALGRGIVDFRATFEALDRAGFSGPCALEIEGSQGETPSEQLICDRVAHSVGYLRGLGRL